eukprot:2253146-Rhodomonas_salina.3
MNVSAFHTTEVVLVSNPHDCALINRASVLDLDRAVLGLAIVLTTRFTRRLTNDQGRARQ